MNIEITESQFKKVFSNILNTLFPNITYTERYGIYYIVSDDETICRVYAHSPTSKELFILDSTINTVIDFIPQVSLKPKLLSKLMSSFITEKTGLKINKVEFWMPDGEFSIKHNYKN